MLVNRRLLRTVRPLYWEFATVHLRIHSDDRTWTKFDQRPDLASVVRRLDLKGRHTVSKRSTQLSLFTGLRHLKISIKDSIHLKVAMDSLNAESLEEVVLSVGRCESVRCRPSEHVTQPSQADFE